MSLTLNARMICHPGHPIRVTAHEFVPQERYERICPECGMAWTITRRTVRVDEGMRMDALDWQSTDYLYTGKGE